jgi:hypothetical protein
MASPSIQSAWFSSSPEHTQISSINYYLNADPDPGSQTNADPDPGQTFKSQKVKFLHKKYIM